MFILNSYLSCSEAREEAANKKLRPSEPVIQEFEIPENFICPLDKEIMKEAVKTSCCATHYCDSCMSSSSRSLSPFFSILL